MRSLSGEFDRRSRRTDPVTCAISTRSRWCGRSTTSHMVCWPSWVPFKALLGVIDLIFPFCYNIVVNHDSFWVSHRICWRQEIMFPSIFTFFKISPKPWSPSLRLRYPLVGGSVIFINITGNHDSALLLISSPLICKLIYIHLNIFLKI